VPGCRGKDAAVNRRTTKNTPADSRPRLACTQGYQTARAGLGKSRARAGKPELQRTCV